MKSMHPVHIALMVAILSLLSACTSLSPNQTAHRTSIAIRPQTQRPVADINRGIGTGETVWHLRSALNVAALSCRHNEENRIADNYNRMLHLHNAVLADAYNAEQNQYRSRYGSGWEDRQDRHMTSVYNFFANPVATRQFCAIALAIGDYINRLTPEQFRDYASPALAQMESPIVAASSLSGR